MTFSSNTCRFILLSFLSLSANAYSVRGVQRRLTAPDLGTADNYAILAQTGISSGGSVITGDIAVSPAARTYMTGFGFAFDNTGTHSTQVTGQAYALEDSATVKTLLTTAVGDMGSAYNEAETATADFINHEAGLLGGKTLTAGV
jgi:hypothetical protein